MKNLVVGLAFSMLLFFGCKHSNSNAFDHGNLTQLLDSAEKYCSTKPEQAQTYLDSASNYHDNLTSNLRFLSLQGRVYSEKGLYDSSIVLLEAPLKNVISSNLDSTQTINLSKINYSLALAYYRKGEFSKSLSFAVQSFYLTDSFKGINLANNYLLTGFISRGLKDYLSALKYFKKSMHVNLEMNTEQFLPYTYSGIALTYIDLEKFDSALIYIDKTLELKKEFGDTVSINSTLSNKAEILKEMGRYDDAILIQRAVIQKGLYRDSYSKAITLISMANLYAEKKQKDSCYSYLTSAEALSNDLKMDHVRLLLTKVYLNYYLLTLNKDSIAHYTNKLLDLNDSLQFVAVKNLTEGIEEEIKSLNEKHKKEIELADAKLTCKKKEVLIYQIVVGIIICMIIIIALIRTLRSNHLLIKRKEKENVQLEHQLENEMYEKEEHIKQLIDLGVSLTNYHELLSVISKELNRYEQSGNLNSSIIQSSIKTALNKTEFKFFQFYLRQLQEGFYQKLMLKFPSLTNTELMVCGLLALEMKSKQIADVLSVETRSIEVYRYRLRKKFGLNKKDDLSLYIKSQVS